MFLTRGTDWGGYLSSMSGPALPFQDLYNAGLLDFFVTKGCQEADGLSSLKNIKWAREAGCRAVGSYYWHYPTWGVEYQLNLYSNAIELEKPDFIALDMEDAYGRSDSEITINAEAVCKGLTERYPNLPFFVYTSADFINTHCPTFNRSIGKYLRWVACWPGVIPTNEWERFLSFDEIKQYPLSGWTPRYPKGWSDWDMWQDVNWPIPEGYGWPFVHAYDWNVSKFTIEQLTGKEKPPIVVDTKPMYNPEVKIQERAWWMRYPKEMAIRPGIRWLDEVWVDGVIVPAYLMNVVGDDHQIYTEVDTNFAGRSKQITDAGLRVSAEAVLDAGYFPMRQFGEGTVLAWDRWNNIMIRDFLKGIVATPSYEYTPSGVRNLKFHPFQAIHVRMTEFHTFPFQTWPKSDWNTIEERRGTNMVPDVWQTDVFTKFLDHLRFFILDGVIPNVPVIFETDKDWYNTYANIIGPLLTQRSDWLYMHIINPKLTSTNTFTTLQPIYQSIGENLDYGIVVPEKFEKRILATGFTWRKQKCSLFNGEPLELSFYQDTSAAMSIFFPMTVPFPPEDPPVDPEIPPTVDPKIAELEAKLELEYAKNDALTKQVTQLEEWASKVTVLASQAPFGNLIK